MRLSGKYARAPEEIQVRYSEVKYVYPAWRISTENNLSVAAVSWIESKYLDVLAASYGNF